MRAGGPTSAPKLIFDPGVDDSAMLLDSVFSVLSTVYGVRPASLREGEFSVNNEIAKMFNVLFDSGALHHSYISESIVDEHRTEWESMIRPFETFVKLADQSTIVKTKEIVRGILSFVSDGGTAFWGEVDAIVWKMKGLDFILGLPDIVRNFITLFFLMLKQYQLELVAGVTEVSDMLPGEVRLWSNEEEHEAPEESQCPIPVAFEPVVNFMEMSYDESLQEYFNMLGDHVGDHLRDCEELWTLLKSELALARFVPKEWRGILGIPDLELQWKDTFPESHPVRARPINKALWETARLEFERLCKYIYRASTSPYASPLVVASKNTKPFIRFCGDYRWVNMHVQSPQAYIPRVQYEIEKLMRFKIWLDIDLTNAFHQFKLAPETSRRLAIQTPWGLVEPAFLPEGVAPAMAHLQMAMTKIFEPLQEFACVIFDNILIGAYDEKDACKKFKQFLEIADKHNVLLKMSKTWLGFDSVKFFGYKISQGKYELDEDRKNSIMSCEMPMSQKAMMRFLGAALFFKSFVPNYSDLAAKLHQMTHKDFNWNEKMWKEDYRAVFQRMKEGLAAAVALFFPDYSLPWILRVDASDIAVGAVLLQVRKKEDGTEVYEPIGFASRKFSETALKWDAFKKEAYAAFFGVDYFAYYLRGKPFILETDHRNLQWIEKSEVPMVVRWRVFMQSFCLYIRHIPGTKNLVADWLSRMLNKMCDMSFEEYMALGDSAMDVSCLMSLMTHVSDVDVQQELDWLCGMTDFDIPDYREAEDLKRPDEFTPDYQDAREFDEELERHLGKVRGARQQAMRPISELCEQYVPFCQRPVKKALLSTIEDGDELIDSQPIVEQDESQPARGDVESLPVLDPPQGRGKDPVIVRERVWTADEMFKEVHGGRQMHFGARRTWLALNKRFPGHCIPYRWVQLKVEECRTCVMYRTGFNTHVEKIYSHLKPQHPRARVGFDGLTITPPDKDGNTHLVVVVDFFKKYVWAHVAKDYSAQSVATALFIYYCTFGVFDEVWTDSGPNILNDTVEQLNKWLQVKHVVALVEQHETCGVEGSNKQIVRHLSTIVYDERIRDRWSDPIVLSLVLFVINDQINSETGVRPLDAMFGSADGPYLNLPTDALPGDVTNAWVIALDADLKKIRQISADYQRLLVEERTRATPEQLQNKYQPGDIVIWERDLSKPKPHKMDAPFTGPWEVIHQKRNIVRCRHLADPEREQSFFVERLHLYVGSPASAEEAAQRDLEQYAVKAVKGWRGDPKNRSRMQFWVEYDDGDAMWVTWKPDLVRCDVWQDYMHAQPELFELRFPFMHVSRNIARLRDQPITGVQPGDVIYVDLRSILGCDTYDALDLPNKYFMRYVCECSYTRWTDNRHKKIEVSCPVLGVKFKDWDNFQVFKCGHIKEFDPDTMILVTPALCIRSPNILMQHNRSKLLRQYRAQQEADGAPQDV